VSEILHEVGECPEKSKKNNLSVENLKSVEDLID
jgi:hypothetical protein